MTEDEKYLNQCLEKAYKKNKEFFGIDIKYNAKLMYSEQERKKILGKNLDEFAAAFVKRNTIYIFAKSVFEKLSPHKIKDYESILVHELNHLFFRKYFGVFEPDWIVEGLACYVQGDWKRTIKKPNPKFLVWDTPDELYNENPRHYYESCLLTVENIINEIGLEHLFSLIKKYAKNPTKTNYNEVFQSFLKQQHSC
jgi:hypothetical protein